MDLRSISNSVSNAVNANMIVTVTASTGYTIGAGLRQVPSYAVGVTGPAQIQALDFAALRQIEGLNLQGDFKVIYLRGVLAGVIRPDSTGGDLVIIAAPAPAIYRGTWLVTKVLESWPLWSKCAITLQEPS
jgi:hypothetical protein